VGGSGKTPVVASIATLLLERGHRPSILSRGYARRRDSDGVVVVSDGERVMAPVETTGDEPQMLARALPGVPVLVCPDRYLAGRLAETRFGATVHVLDDGFQHVQLARSLDLLIVAPADLVDRVLPSGRLREPIDAASAADAVLVPGSKDEAARVATTLGVRAVFQMVNRYEAVRALAANARTPDRMRAIAVAGIARPERFFAAVREQGVDVAAEIAFPDHHWFTAKDLESIDRRAASASVGLVTTTEKDAMRIGARPRWYALPMHVAIEPAASFAEWLIARLT